MEYSEGYYNTAKQNYIVTYNEPSTIRPILCMGLIVSDFISEWEEYMDLYLLVITLIAIVIVILGVSWWKWHAFISLTVASLFLAVFSGLN